MTTTMKGRNSKKEYSGVSKNLTGRNIVSKKGQISGKGLFISENTLKGGKSLTNCGLLSKGISKTGYTVSQYGSDLNGQFSTGNLSSSPMTSRTVTTTVTEYIPVNSIISGNGYSTIQQPISGGVALLTKEIPSTKVVPGTVTEYLPVQMKTTGLKNSSFQPVSGNVAVLTKNIPSTQIVPGTVTEFLPLNEIGNYSTIQHPISGLTTFNMPSGKKGFKKGMKTVSLKKIGKKVKHYTI